jgi:Zn-dependent protease with chaperone function
MDQNYKNHSRLVTGYHGLLALLILAGLIGSIINLYGAWNNESLYSASLITLLFVCCILLFWYTRTFPLKAQDRAIRSEENFRYFLMTGKPLPSELKIGQIIALRFASDEEYVNLVQRAITDKMDPKSIKLAIQNWKPDYHRV